MYGKNLIITLLLVTNIATLYVVFARHRASDFCTFSEKIPEETVNITALKKELTQLFNAVPENCGAAISLSARDQFAGTHLQDMVCLIAGQRSVIEGTLASVKYYLESAYQAFENVAKAEGIREFEGISFRPEAERTALLLVKAFLFIHIFFPKKQEMLQGINFYLLGILLGYDIKDIEFFQQRSDFLDWIHKDMNEAEQIEIPRSYPKFSDEMKNRFENFKKNEWITSGDQDRFNQQRNAALQWLKAQENYSIAELYQQIAELKKQHSIA